VNAGLNNRAARVTWIGLAPERRAPLVEVVEVVAEPGTGLCGDHHAKERPGGRRQVTLIGAEHLLEVADLLGRPAEPAACRRNLVVEGFDLEALRSGRFRIGGALLEGTGDCTPCSRMEENLGSGGLDALRGRGGITARVLEGGTIRLGDAVCVVPERSAG
jgi:MOSC domain-containing protein YiiM